jgi:hypothetical protein
MGTSHKHAKVWKTFQLAPWELDLLPESRRQELSRLADEIEGHETILRQYSQVGKELTRKELASVDNAGISITYCRAKARIWLQPIYDARKAREEKRREALAQREAMEWSSTVDAELERLGNQLTEKVDVDSFFASESRAGFFFKGHANSDTRDTVKQCAEQIINTLLGQFPNVRAAVTYEYRLHYFQVLIDSEYVLQDGEPSLAFSTESQSVLVASLTIEETDLKKNFQGCLYTRDMDPCWLGYFREYIPGRMDRNSWQTLPLCLLEGIINGNTGIAGVEILRRGKDEATTVFRVRNFKNEVTIPDGFAGWLVQVCQPKGLAAGLLSAGLIDKDIATIVENKLSPLARNGISAPGPQPESAVAMLKKIGWTELNAWKAVSGDEFPENATAEQIVKIILEKSS